MNKGVGEFDESKERQLLVIAYALYALGLFGFLLPSIAALILNYQRQNCSGACYGSHHRWLIRTFWWGLLWTIIGFILLFVLIGYFVLFGAAVWWVYRLIRGVLALSDEEAMPPWPTESVAP